MKQALLYMHGFLSSPQSQKARLMRDLCEKKGIAFYAPDLAVSPKEASSMLLEAFDALSGRCQKVALMGSSLGGFYCAWLAARTGARAVLINPAVSPWTVVKNFLGEQTIYGTSRKIVVTSAYAGELEELKTPAFDDPSRVMVLLCTGDDVLNWREAAELYRTCPAIVVDGGDHQVSDFDEHAPGLLNFLFGKK